jgi:hypothetical protein
VRLKNFKNIEELFEEYGDIESKLSSTRELESELLMKKQQMMEFEKNF